MRPAAARPRVEDWSLQKLYFLLLGAETSVGDFYSRCILPPPWGGEALEKSLLRWTGSNPHQPAGGCLAKQSARSHSESQDQDETGAHPAPPPCNGPSHPRSAPGNNASQQIAPSASPGPTLGHHLPPPGNCSPRCPAVLGVPRRPLLARSRPGPRLQQEPSSARSPCRAAPRCEGRWVQHEANSTRTLKGRKSSIWGNKTNARYVTVPATLRIRQAPEEPLLRAGWFNACRAELAPRQTQPVLLTVSFLRGDLYHFLFWFTNLGHR